MALGFMRRHRRWLYGFLWLVIGAFIVLYIPAFTGGAGSPAETVAAVGGLPITVSEFQRALNEQRQELERSYQGRLDAAMLRRLGLEDQVFESLVRDRLMRLEARRLGLRVTDEEAVHAVTQFQQDGKSLGGEEIRRRLEISGISLAEFEESLRNQLLGQKLVALVTDGVSVSPEEAEHEFRRQTEQVKAEYVLVDAARYRAETAVTDDEVKARFEARREDYRVPEKRVLSYLLLDQAALRSRVAVTEGDLDLYYRDKQEDFREEEQVCAAHVLVKVKSSPEAKEGHEEAAARKMAEALLAQIKAGGDFATIAKKSSEDKGSAERGGDLGCFPRERMVREFENAAFALEPGQVSELVKSPFGYHIIRVASRREEQIPPLGQVKERIRAVVTDQKVQALANQKAEAISRGLGRGRTLEEVAKDEGFTVQKSAPIARSDAPDPLSSPTLVARAFELKPGEIEREAFLVPRGAVFIGVTEVQASRLPELKEVQDRIKADLVEAGAREKAKRVAGEIRAQAARVGLDKAATSAGFVRKETPSPVGRGASLGDLGAGATVDEVAFSIPEKTLSEPVRVSAGYAILRVLERKGFDPAAFAAQRSSILESLRREKRRELMEAFLRSARQRFTVVKHPEAFRKVTG